MKGKIIVVLLPLLLLMGLMAAGCNREQTESEYQIYYLNKDLTKVVSREYELTKESEDTKAVISEFLSVLAKDSNDVELKKPITSNIVVNSYDYDGSIITISFSANYESLEPTTEVLTRAAIVRTLCQIKGVEGVTFYIGDAPLVDQGENVIGVMTNDTFVENAGKQINSIQYAELVLYFANKDGNGLVKEMRNVHYSSNISMEKLIMEHLLNGPESADAQTAIPDGTKLVSISVLDGVCYVNLDDTFINNQNYGIEESIVIYSIVDSLTELSSVNKVQISVNGNTKTVYRDSYDLSELYSRNMDILGIEETSETVEPVSIETEEDN